MIVVGFVVIGGMVSVGGGFFLGFFGGGCGVMVLVFFLWGDYLGYYFVLNGGFEFGVVGWFFLGGVVVVI